MYDIQNPYRKSTTNYWFIQAFLKKILLCLVISIAKNKAAYLHRRAAFECKQKK